MRTSAWYRKQQTGLSCLGPSQRCCGNSSIAAATRSQQRRWEDVDIAGRSYMTPNEAKYDKHSLGLIYKPDDHSGCSRGKRTYLHQNKRARRLRARDLHLKRRRATIHDVCWLQCACTERHLDALDFQKTAWRQQMGCRFFACCCPSPVKAGRRRGLIYAIEP